MAPAPVEQIHRSDLLPLTCPQCGGPIRAYEVKWTGKQSAACPYCDSNLPMKKG
jgi:DNA-directed RNA polymerase subunit RPC12/RpoP